MIIKAFLSLALLAIGFGAGVLWNKYDFLNRPIVLTEALVLQESPNQIGSLPKGTVLYPYSYGPSIPTFVVFVNTKDLNLLKPIEFDRPMTVAPLDGYYVE